MTKRQSQTMQVFKMCGMWWKHVRYKRNGEWRNCYAPRWGEAIFSKEPMRISEVKAIHQKREEKIRRIVERNKQADA